MYINLIITKRCNSRCKICGIWKRDHETSTELTASDFKRSLDMNLKGISISGGEPFLRKDLLDVVEILPCNKVFINTNGTLINQVSNLLEHINKEIGFGISIDGMEETHNIQRGVNSFQLAINTIRLLKRKGILVIISFTITPYNIKDINDVYSLSKKLECGFAMRAAQNSIYYECDEKNKFTEKDIRLLREELRALKNNWKENYLPSYFVFNIPDYLENKIKLPPCYALENAIFVSETGNICACPELENISLGNLKEKSLSEIISSKEYKEMKEKTRRLNCPGCWNDCNTLNNLNHAYHGFIKYPAKVASLVIPPRIWNGLLFH